MEPLNSLKSARRSLLPPAALLTVGVGLMLAGSLPVAIPAAWRTLSAPVALHLPDLEARANSERPLTEEEVEEIRAACMRISPPSAGRAANACCAIASASRCVWSALRSA